MPGAENTVEYKADSLCPYGAYRLASSHIRSGCVGDRPKVSARNASFTLKNFYYKVVSMIDKSDLFLIRLTYCRDNWNHLVNSFMLL